MIERRHDGLTAVYDLDSTAELAELARDLQPPDHMSSWTEETWGEAIEGAARGRDRGVREAEELVDAVYQQVDSPRSRWAPSVAGAYPVVPEALAGYPASMRRRVGERSDRAPLRIWVDLTSSAGIGVETLRRRGVAYLALAIALSAERAVELRGVVVLGGGGGTAALTFAIGTQPLDLSVACNALVSQGLVRGLAYQWLKQRAGTGGMWGWRLTPVGSEYLARLRAALGASDDDLVAGPALLYDKAVDPVAFVRREVARFAGRDEP